MLDKFGAHVEGMALDTAENQIEDVDSLTGTFERKRTHDVAIRENNSNAGSAQSTPRKRNKHAAKLGHQDVRGPVPSRASFTTKAAPLEEPHNGERCREEASNSMEAAETFTAPPLNWNAINSTKVRTSLGGGLGKGGLSQGGGLQASQTVDSLGKGKSTHDQMVQTGQAVDGLGKANLEARNQIPQTAQEEGQ